MDLSAVRRYFPTFVSCWCRIRAVPVHRAVALFIAVVVIALECVWVRRFIWSAWSLFGFHYFAMDLGVLGMADVLLFGLYLLVTHPGRCGRLLCHFEIAGGVTLMAFIGCGLRFPDLTQMFCFLCAIPILPLAMLAGLLPEDVGRIYAGTLLFTFPQLLLASGCALMVRYGTTDPQKQAHGVKGLV
jgi:hypothetical protein